MFHDNSFKLNSIRVRQFKLNPKYINFDSYFAQC